MNTKIKMTEAITKVSLMSDFSYGYDSRYDTKKF